MWSIHVCPTNIHQGTNPRQPDIGWAVQKMKFGQSAALFLSSTIYNNIWLWWHLRRTSWVFIMIFWAAAWTFAIVIQHLTNTFFKSSIYVFDSFGPASGRGRLLCTKLWSVKMTNKPYCWVGFVTISSDIFLVGDASPPSVVRCMCSGRFVHLAPHPPGGASRFEDGEDPSHVWPNM